MSSVHANSSPFRHIGKLLGIALGLAAGSAMADLPQYPIQAARHTRYVFNPATGTFERSSSGDVSGLVCDSLWSASTGSGYFFSVEGDGGASLNASVLNWGDVPDGSSFSSLSFDYYLDGTAPVDVNLNFFNDENGSNSTTRAPIDPNYAGGLLLTGLPGSPGGPCCSGWIITVDLTGSGYNSVLTGQDLDGDGLHDFGYAYHYPNPGNATLIGPSVSGDPNAGDNCPGNENAFDWFDPLDPLDPNAPATNYLGTYWFGGYPFASFYLNLCGTPPSSCTGIDPNSVEIADVYTHLGTFAECGRFKFTGTPLSAYPIYLNVAIDFDQDRFGDPNEWVVQNMQFAQSDYLFYTHSVYFPLCCPNPIPADFFYTASGTPQPPPTASYDDLGWCESVEPPAAPVLLAQPGEEESTPPATPPAESPDAAPVGRDKMPDIPQGLDPNTPLGNYCGPTSATNSLIWLAERDGWVDELLEAAGAAQDGEVDRSDSTDPADRTDDEKKIADALLEKMRAGASTDPNFRGLTRGEMEAGKKAFAEDNDLPIEVHGGVDDENAQGAKMFDFIKEELANGQDIEMLINWPEGGAHWVTVIDISFDGDKVTVTVIDPADATGTSEKPHATKWCADRDGNFTAPKGTANRAVAESPKPPPPTCPNEGCDPGDITGDCRVDLLDLSTLLTDFGCTSGCNAGDVDDDGDIDLIDLSTLLTQFGNDCN